MQAKCYCEHCKFSGYIELVPYGEPGKLRCPRCGKIISGIDISDYDAILSQIANWRNTNRGEDFKKCKLGMSAELAACLILCSGFYERWLETTAVPIRRGVKSGNRGRDLRAAWVGLSRDVEVKYTTRSHLIITKPLRAYSADPSDYVDDSYYCVMRARNGIYYISKLATKSLILEYGQRNLFRSHVYKEHIAIPLSKLVDWDRYLDRK